MINISHYKDMLQQPWGKIQYDITFAQLAHLENLYSVKIKNSGSPVSMYN